MHILYVEDDLKLQQQTAKFLASNQHQVTTFTNALDALRFAQTESFDVLLCDYKLGTHPNGLALAQQVRNLRPDCPIVMVSNFATVEDLSRGYDVDVDAYLKRPISLVELMKRIYAASERRRAKYPSTPPQVICGPLTLNKRERTATWHAEPLMLTPTEFTLLAQLASQPGQVFSTNDLCALTKGSRVGARQARELLKQHIFQLRARLGQGGKYTQPIENVRGQGYKLVLTD